MKHRRLLKAALAALLLVLPLILSGCYVAPTDIPANNQRGNTMDFPVYNPTTNPPSATPATAGINTPASGVVQLPTSGNAINPWSTGVLLPTVPKVTVPVVTPPPYTATPSPTPQGSLKLGSKGEEVKTVQRKLKELGFLKGSVDGDFGEATETAVKAFQKQYGLTVDGKVGANTMAKLASARQTAKPAVTATPKPTATPAYSDNTYLRLGDSGSKVRQMQERLITLGYLVGKATGSFDGATEAAVKAFQRRNVDYADGVAGPMTLKALYSSSAKSTSTAAGIIGQSLKAGSEGAAVRVLQTRLKELGYYKGSVDGSFGAGTTDAVKAFQRANSLTVDGAAGSGTLSKLFGGTAKSASAASATATRRPTATPRTTPTPIPDNIYVLVTPAPNGTYATLRRGNYGTPVREMQNALKNQGYFTGTPDSYYGEATELAVMAFQRSNGLQVDGVAGPATLRVLYEGSFPFGS
jgi:peptidoglycan hydrolase-like protein with peptidoglycan-binding domain